MRLSAPADASFLLSSVDQPMTDTPPLGALDADPPRRATSSSLPRAGRHPVDHPRDGRRRAPRRRARSVRGTAVEPQDVQPVEHETLDRALTALITVGPIARARLRRLADVGRAAAPLRPDRVRDHVPPHRPRHHGRLPPPLHPPQLQDLPRGARRARRARLRRDRGPGDLVGGRPPQAPRLLRQATATPTAPTSTTASACAGRCAASRHAHLGWLFIHTERGSRERYAPDLIADPVVEFVDRTFFVWALGGLAAAFGLGYAIGGTWRAGLTGLLWGGAVRMLVLHHMTYSINSLCHFFGRRDYATEDHSRNLVVARAADLRRGVAQQPPRLPHLRQPRPELAPARRLGAGDPRAGARRARVGRRQRGRGAPRAQAGLRLRRMTPAPIPPVRELIARRTGEELALNDRHLNPQMGRILRTLGFDKVWVGGEGAHLIDSDGRALPRPVRRLRRVRDRAQPPRGDRRRRRR